MDRLLVYCRAGFEGECAAELQQRAVKQGVEGYAIARPRTAYAVFILPGGDAGTLYRQLAVPGGMIFPRQLLLASEELTALPQGDRISPILAALESLPGPFGDVWLEYPDSQVGREISAFCRKFMPHLRTALIRAGQLCEQQAQLPRLHLLFPDSSMVLPALSWPMLGSPWPMGIPRLKMPRDAPSRSTLKLDEAFQVMLSSEERERWLRPGMQAVDLGAAPGGWSYQLLRRHIHVVAVDNGLLSPALLDSGMVEHRQDDGFRFRPRRPVDWMVCDMVEQPIRIARLMADWVGRGDCQHCIFNLKLPMKRRFQEVQYSIDEIHRQLATIPHILRARQLYHDREEITVYLGRMC